MHPAFDMITCFQKDSASHDFEQKNITSQRVEGSH